MDADAAAAFWIVRAESRGLDPGEIALRDAWLAEPANLAAYQQSLRTLALLDAAVRTKAVRVRSDTTAPRAPGFGDLS
jgi:ferric-dicitrate binding protein FerR (iron transport regulator)